MKVTRKIIEIDEELCDGCGTCVPACAEGAIEIVDGKARLAGERLCDGLGACLGECPTGALRIVEREAEEFDEEAVEEHLKGREGPDEKSLGPVMMCPSSGVEVFPTIAEQETGQGPEMASRLGHWPVQIRLVPAEAPFLRGAHLLITADCAPVAYPTLHRDFLGGKVLLLGCPKFDDAQGYVSKLSEIFRKNDPSNITILVMEVPCCGGLPAIVKKALEASGKGVPGEVVVLDRRGRVIRKEPLAG